MIPSRKWAYDLIRLKHMPENIFRHSHLVCNVASIIASHIPDKVNIILVNRGALLHDICKMDSIGTGKDHAQLGGRLLDILDCPELASIVRQHVRLETMDLNEAMIVNYADKRVMHDRVVSLSRRFVDLMERYGKDDVRKSRIFNLYSKSLEMEKIITEITGIRPEMLEGLNLVNGDHSFDGV
jgi:putative nucleotidyltransferase with HDIG domain